ncbi:predicted protein [Naegleria gruberi]|uniref:Predicted protein n=1 Tax=Naegleria gruberi TaxID=5762 RepID=D2VER6_NAEGR|nr:uncharacterized protein NAEGRDRAFT_67367 [Naegleria gruberi]EFC44554.1 predicted protein [Naegleria gruberi]|eukprot:XP_002677298.1 predicted protein [Naegleria gruberi strain NEG-M]
MNIPPPTTTSSTLAPTITTTDQQQLPTSPLIIRRSTAVFQRNSTGTKVMGGGKRYACPCLNLSINLSSSRDMKYEEWCTCDGEGLFSKTQLDEFKIKFSHVDCKKLSLTRGTSIAGIQSSLDIFMENNALDESESIVKAFKCLNCETFFGFYFEKFQTFLVNTTQLLDEVAQEKLRQQEDFSKIFNIVPKTTNINTSDNLLKHPLLVQYQKDMQKKLNDERISMEMRIKEFMKNEKIQYQKLLLKTQTEKDTIFRKAKTILAESSETQSFDVTNTVTAENDTELSESSRGRMSSAVSQDGLSDLIDERVSRSLSPSAVDEKIKKAMSTNTFFKPNPTLMNPKEKIRLEVKPSANKFKATNLDVDEDLLTQKSFHYKKMTTQLMSRTYTPSAFFSFDEEGAESQEPTKEEEEEEDEVEEEEQSMAEQTSPQPQTRSRRRLEFSKPPPVVVKPAFYGSSVPISITMRPQAQQQTANEKLPLYYEESNETKPETPEQRKQRTKSFKTKPRLDDDPFTEVPQSYIERYMTFREEYMKNIDTLPEKASPAEEPTEEELKDSTTEKQTEETFDFDDEEEGMSL